jgi:hypothetical protein
MDIYEKMFEEVRKHNPEIPFISPDDNYFFAKKYRKSYIEILKRTGQYSILEHIFSYFRFTPQLIIAFWNYKIRRNIF